MARYFAKKTRCNAGHTHDSGKEARRCNDLTLMERAGEIAGLQQQPVFKFHIDGRPVMMRNGQQARYTADFSYVENGRKIVEDCKASNGYVQEASALRMALLRAMHPSIELRIVK